MILPNGWMCTELCYDVQGTRDAGLVVMGLFMDCRRGVLGGHWSRLGGVQKRDVYRAIYGPGHDVHVYRVVYGSDSRCMGCLWSWLEVYGVVYGWDWKVQEAVYYPYWEVYGAISGPGWEGYSAICDPGWEVYGTICGPGWEVYGIICDPGWEVYGTICGPGWEGYRAGYCPGWEVHGVAYGPARQVFWPVHGLDCVYNCVWFGLCI